MKATIKNENKFNRIVRLREIYAKLAKAGEMSADNAISHMAQCDNIILRTKKAFDFLPTDKVFEV